ncbi:MAG: hypothetical protein V4709_03135 [Pseudomonadota bacterium]
MLPKSLLKLGLLACTLLAASAPALAGRLAEIDIMDRDTGETLRQYRHQGRRYVVGTPGHAYEIAVRSRSGERLLAVMSVDGVNILSGETAATEQGGYVFAPWQREQIRGWRKNLAEVAQFNFTALPNSYAARTGRPRDVGVIGIALFREARPQTAPDCCWFDEERDRSERFQGKAESESRAPSASADAAAPELQAKRRAAAPSLGTGHGQREHSPVGTTTFERASSQPDEVITLYYDSREKLVAQGVLPETRQYARRRPQAFPGGFVPDP